MHSINDAAIAEFDRAIGALQRSGNDAAVHSARQAAKRIRSALRLLRHCLGPAEYRRINGLVRDAAKPLTDMRDAFMLVRSFDALTASPAALRRTLAAHYRQRRRSLERAGRRSVLRALRTARGAFRSLRLPPGEAESALSGIRKVYKQGRAAFARARCGADEPLHEWASKRSTC